LKPTFQAYEKALALKWPGATDDAGPAQSEGLALPPPDLRVLVAGTPDADWFLKFGRSMFDIIVDTLQRHGGRVQEFSAILEFGCGCGRVLRHWQTVHGPRVYGVDYNARLVDWCRQNLPFARLATNTLYPPLGYADGTFDCVYAISVFTHMSEELQRLWMQELGRILRPGGYLLITTQGASFRERLAAREREAFDAGQLVVRYEEASGMNLCSVYHPEGYVRQRLSDGYVVQDFIPAGTQGVLFQDLYLLTKN
jgi:SAM-dependent methyltransferase